MAFIIGFICAIIAVFSCLKTKFVFNPLTTMLAIWSVLLPLSGLRLYQTYALSDKALLVIAVGLIGYTIGTSIGMIPIKYVYHNTTIREAERQSVDYVFNYKLLYILNTISILVYSFLLVQVIRLLLSGRTYIYIRELFVSEDEGGLRSNHLINVLRSFIATPMTYLMMAVFPIEVFFKRKDRLLIIQTVLLIVFFVLTTGGRSVMLWFPIYIVYVYLYKRKITSSSDRHRNRKNKRRIILGVIVMGFFLYIMTINRKGEGVDLLREAYIYFVAPLPHFDVWIDRVSSNNVIGYGLSSFYGLLYPFVYLLRLLHIFNGNPEFVLKIYNYSFSYLEASSFIGPHTKMNAFVTIFYQPFVDGRFLGVFFILFVFGFICGRSFYKANYQNNLKSLLIYLLLFQKIIFSFVRFYFTQQAQSLCFILAFVIFDAVILPKDVLQNNDMRGFV